MTLIAHPARPLPLDRVTVTRDDTDRQFANAITCEEPDCHYCLGPETD
jgi:hypothetical protein